MQVSLRPVAGRVLLQFRTEPRKAGSLHVRREIRRDMFREAYVRALPPSYDGELSVGDLVLCPPWPAREFILGADRLALVDVEAIPCVLE